MGTYKAVLPKDCDVYVKTSTGGEIQIADSTGALYTYGSKITPPSTASWTAVGTTQSQTLENKTLGAGCKKSLAAGSTDTNLPNYGVSTVSWSSNGGLTYTLDPPVAGIEKTIVHQSTEVLPATAVWTVVGSGGVPLYDDSTTYAPKLYLGFGPPHGVVKLLGLSTAAWSITQLYGNVKLSTSTTFSS